MAITVETDTASGSMIAEHSGRCRCQVAETAAAWTSGRLLLWSSRCRVLRGVARDTVLTDDDVEIPAGRRAAELRGQQHAPSAATTEMTA